MPGQKRALLDLNKQIRGLDRIINAMIGRSGDSGGEVMDC